MELGCVGAAGRGSQPQCSHWGPLGPTLLPSAQTSIDRWENHHCFPVPATQPRSSTASTSRCVHGPRMYCALCKPDLLMGQLTEPIPWFTTSPLQLSHPLWVCLGLWSLTPPQCPPKPRVAQAEQTVGQKLHLLHHLSQKQHKDTKVVFRWFEISCLVLSTRQGLGPRDRGNSSHCCSPIPACLHPGSLGLCIIQRFCSHGTL